MKKISLLLLPFCIGLLASCGETAKKLESIRVITRLELKTEYTIGEAFSTDGLGVEAKYSDGSATSVTNFTTDITPGYKFVAADINDARKVTVSYAENNVTVKGEYNIKIYKKLTGATLEGDYKKEYHVGEAFSTTGLVVKSVYNDGSTEVETAYTISPEKGYVFKDTDVMNEFPIIVNITKGANTETATENIKVLNKTSSEVKNTITAADLSATDTSYKTFNFSKTDTGVTYQGESARFTKDSVNYIQFKATNGIYSSSSTKGTVNKIDVEWNVDKTRGTNPSYYQTRYLDIYASNTAFSSFDNLSEGDLKGKLECSGTKTESSFTINGSYKYILLKGDGGAVYFKTIDITWSI